MVQVKNNVISLIIFFLLLWVFTKIAGPIPFSVNSVVTQKSTTFDVSGEGKVQITPDSANVSAGVSAKGNTQESVQTEMNTIINAVVANLKKLGIDSKDIQTTNYSINPNYDYSTGGQKLNGYQADTNLSIKVRDINKVNQVIDAATSGGATNVNNLGFDNSDKTKAENEARQLALSSAKKKAQDIANAAGFKLGKLINYQEGQNGVRPMYAKDMFLSPSSANSSTEVQVGSNEIVITVTLSYEIN